MALKTRLAFNAKEHSLCLRSVNKKHQFNKLSYYSAGFSNPFLSTPGIFRYSIFNGTLYSFASSVLTYEMIICPH